MCCGVCCVLCVNVYDTRFTSCPPVVHTRWVEWSVWEVEGRVLRIGKPSLVPIRVRAEVSEQRLVLDAVLPLPSNELAKPSFAPRRPTRARLQPSGDAEAPRARHYAIAEHHHPTLTWSHSHFAVHTRTKRYGRSMSLVVFPEAVSQHTHTHPRLPTPQTFPRGPGVGWRAAREKTGLLGLSGRRVVVRMKDATLRRY
jgi:hypothetical protein